MANPIQEDRGFIDADLLIADAQAIPTDGAADNSEHCQDFALTAPQIEAGIPVKLKIKVTTAFAISAGTPTLTIGVITDGTAPTGASWSSVACWQKTSPLGASPRRGSSPSARRSPCENGPRPSRGRRRRPAGTLSSRSRIASARSTRCGARSWTRSWRAIPRH